MTMTSRARARVRPVWTQFIRTPQSLASSSPCFFDMAWLIHSRTRPNRPLTSDHSTTPLTIRPGKNQPFCLLAAAEKMCWLATDRGMKVTQATAAEITKIVQNITALLPLGFGGAGEMSVRAAANHGIVTSSFVRGTSMISAATRDRPLKSSLSHHVWLEVLIWCGAPMVSSKN